MLRFAVFDLQSVSMHTLVFRFCNLSVAEAYRALLHLQKSRFAAAWALLLLCAVPGLYLMLRGGIFPLPVWWAVSLRCSCFAVLSPPNVGLWGRVRSAFGRCYPIGDFGLLFPRLLGCRRRSMLCECAVVPCCASLQDCSALESFYWLPCLVLPHN